jgi:hypothetical protein
MFVGHYSVAFAAKTEKNKIPLWVLFIGVQVLDYIWATFVLLGIEKLRIVPGFTSGSMLDAYYMPYSHSLIAALLWSAVAGLMYKWFRSRHGCLYSAGGASGALVVGLAVLSHWILDFIAHPPDLAIYNNSWKVGLSLWNHRGLEFGLEIAMLVTGIALYLRRNATSLARKWGVIGFGIMLVVVQVGETFVPRKPLTAPMTAMGVLVFYTLFAGVAFLLAKRRAQDVSAI